MKSHLQHWVAVQLLQRQYILNVQPQKKKITCMLHQGRCKFFTWISTGPHIHPELVITALGHFLLNFQSKMLHKLVNDISIIFQSLNCEAYFHIPISGFHRRSRVSAAAKTSMFGSWLICLKKISTGTNQLSGMNKSKTPTLYKLMHHSGINDEVINAEHNLHNQNLDSEIWLN